MIISNSKYMMSEEKTSVYSVQMRLVIMNLQKHDLGGYKCISKNSIGDAEGNIRLYGEFPRLTRKQIVKSLSTRDETSGKSRKTLDTNDIIKSSLPGLMHLLYISLKN